MEELQRIWNIVLIVEALTKDFGEIFWQFIENGKYEIKIKNNGKPCFYRFDKPKDSRFPKMIELFYKTDYKIEDKSIISPIHIDEEVSSLSAILLNDSYYQVLLDGREVVNGISILKPELIIPFKAKAWLDLRNRTNVDLANIKKHRNDIIRIASEIVLRKCVLPIEVYRDK